MSWHMQLVHMAQAGHPAFLLRISLLMEDRSSIMHEGLMACSWPAGVSHRQGEGTSHGFLGQPSPEAGQTWWHLHHPCRL